MAMRLPVVARKVLDDDTNFLKRDKPVVDRLRTSTDGHYISALQKIDNIFSDHTPINSYSGEMIFRDPLEGQWGVFFDYLVSCSTMYSKEKADDIRNSRKDFAEKLKQISNAANELSKLMRAADILGSKYGFSEVADVHPLGLLQNTVANQADAETRYRYDNWVAETVAQARSFDLKYFPSIPNLLDEISRQYSQDFETTGMAKVANSTNKINDFYQQLLGDLNHAVEINHFSPRILEPKVITLFDWASIFSISLGVDVSLDDMKNSRRKNAKV